ncbi:MAG: peroxiredoxin family protein [Chloroherpetonaceae bacterium]|nr:peroxiredoxin family protein [Chloroherpetonaceae bacterium]
MPSILDSINPITTQFTNNFIPRVTIDRFALGDFAPNFTLTDASGKKTRLSDFYGKPILLVFTRIFTDKIFCPICYPHLQQLQRDFDVFKNRGAELVVLNTTTAEMTRQIALEQQFQFPFLSDPNWEVYNLYGLGAALGAPLPAQFVLDQQGKIMYKYLSGTGIEDMLPSLPNNGEMLRVIEELQ